MAPIRFSAAALIDFVTLYAFLVIFSFAIKFILHDYLSVYYGYFHMGYDRAREYTYIALCFLTPLSILPAGTRLKTGSQFIFTAFMSFVGLGSPIFLLDYVAPNIFWSFYAFLFASFLLLAISTRIRLVPIPSPFTERGYFWLLATTVALFVVVFGIGASTNFHIVSFEQLYDVRYSEEQSSAAFIVRVANMYMFSFGGFFLGLAVMYRRYALALVVLGGFVVCYGLAQLKAAVLAPIWLIYLYFAFRYFIGNSTVRYYVVLTLPFWAGLALYLLFPTGRTIDGDYPYIWAYLNISVFRQYGVTANALGLYYNFFQTHPVTYWSQITGVDFLLHYPYGDHTVAIEMQRRYGLGNYNSSFLATEAIESYGYQALPVASALVAILFVAINTGTKAIRPAILALMMFMPCLMIDERPFSTSLLTGGIIFLVFYLAWLPRSWLISAPD
jgi:hypothetical protein